MLYLNAWLLLQVSLRVGGAHPAWITRVLSSDPFDLFDLLGTLSTVLLLSIKRLSDSNRCRIISCKISFTAPIPSLSRAAKRDFADYSHTEHMFGYFDGRSSALRRKNDVQIVDIEAPIRM